MNVSFDMDFDQIAGSIDKWRRTPKGKKSLNETYKRKGTGWPGKGTGKSRGASIDMYQECIEFAKLLCSCVNDVIPDPISREVGSLVFSDPVEHKIGNDDDLITYTVRFWFSGRNDSTTACGEIGGGVNMSIACSGFDIPDEMYVSKFSSPPSSADEGYDSYVDGLSRRSLTKPSKNKGESGFEYDEDDDEYIGLDGMTGEGIRNIVALFNNGYTAHNTVKGYWLTPRGPGFSRVIGSRPTRDSEEAGFMQDAVDNFEAIVARYEDYYFDVYLSNEYTG